MRELGAESAAEHQKIVDFIKACEFEKVIFVGNLFCCSRTFIPDILNAQELYRHYRPISLKDYTILIKGSNGIKLGSVADYLYNLLLFPLLFVSASGAYPIVTDKTGKDCPQRIGCKV